MFGVVTLLRHRVPPWTPVPFRWILVLIAIIGASMATTPQVEKGKVAEAAAPRTTSTTTTSGRPPKTPNVILIIADDLGWGDLGCYGNTTLRTPHIDRLAKEGATFTHALAAASICTPSRTAIMTGRYPIRAGMATSTGIRVVPFTASTGGLMPNEVTFPKLAQGRGYSTALIGKWHLGLHCWTRNDFCHHPLNHGFDYYYGIPWTNARDIGDEGHAIDRVNPALRRGCLAVAVASLLTLYMFKGKTKRWFTILLVIVTVILPATLYFLGSYVKILNGILMRNHQVIEQPFRVEGLHQRFLREAGHFITTQSEAQTPFLLVLALTHVHTSLKPTPAFKGRSRHGLYGDIVEEMDWTVGQVMQDLIRLRLQNDTLIFFTSDNGGHLEEVDDNGHRQGGFNGPLRGGKGMGGMEGGIRVPTLAWWPNHIPPGKRIDWPISNMDFFPTIAHVLGIPIPETLHLDGENLYDLMTTASELNSGQQSSPLATPHPRFMAHYCGSHIHAARWAVEDGRVWKALYASPVWLPNTTRCHYMCPCVGSGVTWHDPPLLYNIATDVEETQPLSSSSDEYREIMKIIDEQLQLHQASVEPVLNQLDFPRYLWLPWLQPCCQLPTCTCAEDDQETVVLS